MFRLSMCHLQVDICNILGSVQVMCGREISLLAGFCYKSGLYVSFNYFKIKIKLKLN
jgi:hypothetical protein